MNKIKREEREDLHTFSDTTMLQKPICAFRFWLRTHSNIQQKPLVRRYEQGVK